MTALFASMVAAVSGIGLVRQDKEDAACAGRSLPAADGPGGDLASGPATADCCARRTRRGLRRPTAPDCTNFARRVRRYGGQRDASAARLFLLHAGVPRPRNRRDPRCHDPPGTAAASLAARGVRANRRTMPPAPARSFRAQ